MSRYTIKTGDTSPAEQARLVGPVVHEPVDLSGATVVLHVRDNDTAYPCIIVDETDGIVAPTGLGALAPPDDRDTVTLDIEWQVTFGNGDVQTFPTKGYDELHVWRDLDP